MSEDAVESIAPPETPLGVTLVSCLVVVYGMGWAAIHFMAATRQSDPNTLVHFNAILGLLLVVVGLGLWERKWTAWSVAVTVFGAMIIAQLLQTAFTPTVIVPVLIVAYLFVRQDLYFHRQTRPTESHT